jgi:hypothetical protein
MLYSPIQLKLNLTSLELLNQPPRRDPKRRLLTAKNQIIFHHLSRSEARIQVAVATFHEMCSVLVFR